MVQLRAKTRRNRIRIDESVRFRPPNPEDTVVEPWSGERDGRLRVVGDCGECVVWMPKEQVWAGVAPGCRCKNPERPDKTQCKNGHPWPEHLYVSPQGHSRCRQCDRDRARRNYQSRKDPKS